MTASISSSCLSGLRVLVVDDDQDARELLAYLLQAFGAVVHVADAPVAARTILAEGTFDAMISDICMPGEDGYSLMQSVRSHTRGNNRRIPAIALTACASDMDHRRALSSGFDVHMTKPLDPPSLVQAVLDLASRPCSKRPEL